MSTEAIEPTVNGPDSALQSSPTVNRREFLKQPTPAPAPTPDEPIGRNPVREAIKRIIGGPRAMSFLMSTQAGFSPSDIASLAHWYDATEITGSDGDAIGTWTDQEGTDDLTQATSAKKPTLRTNELNSKQGLEFDGSDDFIQGDFTDISQANHVFLVARKRSTGGSGNMIDGGDANGRQIIEDNSTPNWQYFAGSQVDSGTGADTSAHIFTALFNGASSTLRLDATQIANGDPGDNSLSGLTVGGSYNDASFSVVDVFEVLLYDANLSDSDRNSVESYLSDKWGITI